MKTQDKSSPFSYVYFALHGGDFDPQIITKALGINPTTAWKKGDKGQYLPNQKFSHWRWATEEEKEAIFLDELVDEVVEKFKDKIEIINKLKEDYQLESALVIVAHIDTNSEKSTPALGHNLKTIEFLYKTKTVTDIDIYRYDSAEREE